MVTTYSKRDRFGAINLLYISIIVIISILMPPDASRLNATELFIPEINAQAGQRIEIPIMIDTVDKLAGIKIVLQYDSDLLKYIDAARTSHTASLIHIVNDKIPGRLIIVMAGAKGIKEGQFSIFTIFFDISASIDKKLMTKIQITKAELVSDQLKNIEYTVKTVPMGILPRQ